MFKITDNTDTKMYFETAQECAQYIIDNAEAWEEYNETIRDYCGDTEIMGLQYDTALAWERVDPIAYRCGYSDWMDCNYQDIVYDLEHLDTGDSIEWFGYCITKKGEEK